MNISSINDALDKLDDFDNLNELDDIDLIKRCEVDDKADSLCLDQDFWLSRIVSKFPYLRDYIAKKFLEENIDITIKKYPNYWSDYYIRLIKINPSNVNIILKKGPEIGR